MIKICLLFGGRSAEHEVSLKSAYSVAQAIDQTKYEIVPVGITRTGDWLLYDGPLAAIADGSWEEYALQMLAEKPSKYSITILGSGGRSLKSIADFVLPIVHGTYCEDGKLQGLLEMADIPYGGCGVTASATAMDKIIAKQVFECSGIPVTPYTSVLRQDFENDPEGTADRIEKELGFPLYVKPANCGSSVGISKVSNREDLIPGLRLAARHDRRILCEKGIDCREIETAILGNHDVRVSIPGEIVATEDFYDYTSKYVDDGKPKMKIPAELPEETIRTLQDYAARAYTAIDGAGFARCDFFIDKKTGDIYLNEINTIPGFTAFSMFPLLWEATGSLYSQTIERIIEAGYERYNDKTDRTSAELRGY